MVFASVGSVAFRNCSVIDDSNENWSKDLLENGKLSCAYFVSAMMKIFDLIADLHVTVDGTIGDMKISGWHEIVIRDQKDIFNILQSGDVIVWKGDPHKHIGFYFGAGAAISNCSGTGTIIAHRYDYQKIEKIFRFNF